MDRRRFMRVAGGGFVFAATAASTGCSQEMPAAAIEAWQGPGQEADIRRWILGYAILAPHSHNLQSWLVDLGTPDEIVLRCDLARLLPETDPFSPQIMMSHGTFLELLDIAARQRGLRAEITLSPKASSNPDPSTSGLSRASGCLPIPPCGRIRCSRKFFSVTPTEVCTSSSGRCRLLPGRRCRMR